MARKQTGTFWKRLQDIGPAIVVAAVVLGPGSIVGASSVGCQYGLLLWWVVPLAGILMIGMTASAMMVGVMHRETPVQSVARAFGRPAALVIGIMMLVAITLFQASNNNAMLMAIEGFWGSETASPGWLRWMVLGAVNALVIALVCWGRDDLYRWVERSMMVLVGVMVLAFATSLVFSLLPNQTDEMKSAPTATDRVVESNQLAEREVASESESPAPLPIGWMNVIALIATTFSVAGAFYQAYQVREKGWTPRDLQTGMIDCVVGIGTLTVLTLMVLATAAISLHGRIRAEELNSAADVALALRPLFGASAQYVFAIGILAGALSSFLVNAMIDGVQSP
ncbi:MAG: divalent metal cation transporter [Planctomycetota bacterium]